MQNSGMGIFTFKRSWNGSLPIVPFASYPIHILLLEMFNFFWFEFVLELKCPLGIFLTIHPSKQPTRCLLLPRFDVVYVKMKMSLQKIYWILCHKMGLYFAGIPAVYLWRATMFCGGQYLRGGEGEGIFEYFTVWGGDILGLSLRKFPESPFESKGSYLQKTSGRYLKNTSEGSWNIFSWR